MTEKSVFYKYCLFCLMILLMAIANIALAEPVSREAQKHMNRAMAAVEMADSPADYEEAILEYEQVIKIAPNWTAPYFNLGFVQNMVGKYQNALESYQKYLELSPNAPDKEQVQTEIDQIEYKLEKVTKAAKIKSWLEGEWIMTTMLQASRSSWPITFIVNGNSIDAYLPTTRSMGYIDKCTDYKTISIKQNGNKIQFSIELKQVYTEPGISELLQAVNAEYELNQIVFNEMKGTQNFSSKKYNSDGSIRQNENGTEKVHFRKEKHSDNWLIKTLIQ